MASPNVPQSVKDMMNDTHAPTAPLDDFLAIYKADPDIWWVIPEGHHLNLFEAALERIGELELLLTELKIRDL